MLIYILFVVSIIVSIIFTFQFGKGMGGWGKFDIGSLLLKFVTFSMSMFICTSMCFFITAILIYNLDRVKIDLPPVDTRICSITNNKDINSSFFLGCGAIDSVDQYSFYIKNNDNGLNRKNIPCKYVTIYETDDIKPTYRILKYTYNRSKWIFPWFLMNPEYEYQNKNLYVPQNTVIMNFKLQ